MLVKFEAFYCRFGCWLNLKPFTVVLDVNIVLSCFECCFQKVEHNKETGSSRLKLEVGSSIAEVGF